MHERPRSQLLAAGDDGTKPAPGHSSRPSREPAMPDKDTLRRAKRDKRQGKSPTTQAGEFVREEIHHIREGKHGARSARQAIAIGLSKARRAGVTCHRPRRARYPGRHARARSAPTNVGMVRRRVASRRPGGNAPPGAPSGASHTPRHLIAPSPGRRILQPPDERGYSAQLRLGRRRVPRARRDDRPPPGRRRAHARTAPGPEHLHINRGGKGLRPSAAARSTKGLDETPSS